MTASTPMPSLDIARLAAGTLDDLQAEDPQVLDVRELSQVTDYYLLVSGNSQPHVRALSDEVEAALRKEKLRPYRRSGTAESGWIVLDYVDIVIHVMTRESRDYYQLEQLWNDAPRLEWPLA